MIIGSLPVPLWSETSINHQGIDPTYLEDIFFPHPGSGKLHASCSRTCVQLPATGLKGGGWEAATVVTLPPGSFKIITPCII